MLSRRLKIGTFFDIGLYVHWSFFLLPLWIAASALLSGHELLEIAVVIAFVLVCFTCVILHEYGHALAARAFGIGTRDITMLPIGGVARLERMPRDPKQEIIVAIAGPAVNVAIAIVLAIGLLCVHGIRYQAATEQNMFAFFLLKVNLALVGFNMIPAFPMDGGRVLRAVATMFTNYHRATFIAMRVGQVLAITLGTVGYFYYEMMFSPLIAVFILWVGAMEFRQVDIASKVRKHTARDAMLRQFETVRVECPISELADLAADHVQRSFPVVQEDQYCGMVTHASILRAIQAGREATAQQIMEDTVVIHADDDLQTLLPGLPRVSDLLPVVNSQHEVIGLLDPVTCIQRVQLRHRDDSEQDPQGIDEVSESPMDVL